MMNVTDLLSAYNMQESALQSDIFYLYGWARWSRALTMVELGAWPGASTKTLRLALEQNGGKLLISVDKNPKCYSILPASDSCWKFVCGDTRDLNLPDSLGLKKETLQFLFVDSSHVKKNTRAELKIWMPYVASGGVVVFHDTMGPHRSGVKIPLKEYLKAGKAGTNYKYYEMPASKFGLGVLVKGTKND